MLIFIDPDEKADLSITARADLCRDPDKAAEIWKSTDNVWWRGPHDPNVRVLRVTPLKAELWDGPASEAIVAYEFAKARLTGAEPSLGENRNYGDTERGRSPDRRDPVILLTTQPP